MNDEIKEILDDLVVNETTGMCYLSNKLTKQIKDFITNLYQELQESNDNAEWWHNRFNAVQQENERLKKELDNKEFVFVGTAQNKTRDFIKYLIKEKNDYKSCCKKAIEYNNQIIKDTKDFYKPTTDVIYSGDSLIDIATQNINILQGENNG